MGRLHDFIFIFERSFGTHRDVWNKIREKAWECFRKSLKLSTTEKDAEEKRWGIIFARWLSESHMHYTHVIVSFVSISWLLLWQNILWLEFETNESCLERKDYWYGQAVTLNVGFFVFLGAVLFVNFETVMLCFIF